MAMLGAASEGAWIEMGLALAAHFPGDSQAGKLAATLNDPLKSTKAMIAAACHFYELPKSARLHTVSAVLPKRLRQIEQWSDQVRESRNVLHWGATPTVPNTYEKVAVLLMDAVSELSSIASVRACCGLVAL